ncbi:acyl-CoA dehydrogenase family protein [Frankia sp. CNm7]|uniref:Acyl-CoA dehydrogenase family protein n=1 Tax=Frankia nepalensis TaxID=1836974 RepID=A0A937RDY4_9ACTN|nr:acyl-CoA dehydrogenase family protein [Frankia nepalensis]MBL7501756.1 acyl-CoA dehydrogenase family protein [Frankia nepalensis]MBL7513549.1 acyl-CoA dehydrogenase family protein [Frankia nepalensis]MBL7519190.1 acyl-CoA dehydrogenase family protein [Frankia nepalensis]MBL7628182.1 acyl-CoA dehydrogenase family protein [Frankia nepalensis]
MRIAYTPEQEKLRADLRAYYERLLTPDVRAALAADSTGPAMRRVVRQMGADGWLGIGWPTEYGGQGRGHVEQFIFFDESLRAGAPVPMLTINTVGPTIRQFGTDEQKERFLPAIVRGETHFCIGYSEPEAGTDLAALRTTAVRDGDRYVVNGSKLWTSYGPTADYCWLAVRTDPAAPRHRGISILIVPMDTPGITVTPLRLIGDHEIASVHYDDVAVPVANLVGAENRGWSLITNQLNHERVTLASPGMVDRALHEVIAWAKRARLPDGRRRIDEEWVQIHLARAYAGFSTLRLLNWKVAADAERGVLDVADASSVKVFGTELYLDALNLLFEVVGEAGYLAGDAEGAAIAGRLESLYRGLVILTFGGGVNELQRDLIAVFGLGMPMSRR